MTHFLQDILRQPEELQRTIEILTGRNKAGRGAVDAATAAIRTARHVYLTGIGSSWHAALNVSVLFHRRAYPVYFADAAELLTFATFPKDSAMILISRSGKSTEIVQLAAKARRAGVNVIGITNAPEGTLAKEAHIAIVVPVAFDHAISVNTYTTLALAAGMLAHRVIQEGNGSVEEPPSGEAGTREPPLPLSEAHNKEKRQQAAALQMASSEYRGGLQSPPEACEAQRERQGRPPGDGELAESLSRTIAEAGRAIPRWQEQVAASIWLAPHSTTYFLAQAKSRRQPAPASGEWRVQLRRSFSKATPRAPHPQEAVPGVRAELRRPPADSGVLHDTRRKPFGVRQLAAVFLCCVPRSMAMEVPLFPLRRTVAPQQSRSLPESLGAPASRPPMPVSCRCSRKSRDQKRRERRWRCAPLWPASLRGHW